MFAPSGGNEQLTSESMVSHFARRHQEAPSQSFTEFRWDDWRPIETRWRITSSRPLPLVINGPLGHSQPHVQKPPAMSRFLAHTPKASRPLLLSCTQAKQEAEARREILPPKSHPGAPNFFLPARPRHLDHPPVSRHLLHLVPLNTHFVFLRDPALPFIILLPVCCLDVVRFAAT